MGLSGHAAPAAVLSVIIVHTVLGSLVVAARLYARLKIARNGGRDDFFIGLSYIFALATTIAQGVQVKNGVGTHQVDVDPEAFIRQTRALYVSIWCYNLSLSCTKASILLQYLRIFPQRRFRIACYVMLAVVFIYTCYTFFTAVFLCSPVSYFWDRTIKDGKCLDRTAVWLANSGLNIATDIITTILPLPILRQLELPKRQRRALMIVFGLGGLTCVVSIFRLHSLYIVSKAKDVSWQNPLAAIWSNVEIWIAIICSCLPTLRCLFPRILKSQISISRSRDDPEDHDSGGANGDAERCGPRLFSKYKINRVRKGSIPDVFGPQHVRQKSSCTRAAVSDEHIEFNDWTKSDSTGTKQSLPLDRIHVTTAIDQEVVEIKPDWSISSKTDENGERDGHDVDTESVKELVRKT